MELCHFSSGLWTKSLCTQSHFLLYFPPFVSLKTKQNKKTGPFKLCYFTHPLLISCQGRILARKSTLWQNTRMKNFSVIPAGCFSRLGTGPTTSDAHFSAGLFIDKHTILSCTPAWEVDLITELCTGCSSHFKRGSDYKKKKKKWRAEIMIAIPFIVIQVKGVLFN